MAQQKVLGIETEYGIVLRGVAEPNPVSASSLLINAYVATLERERGAPSRVGWDFEDESPANDARGPSGPASPPEVETHLVNAVLTNGARYYVDHAHPELSTPECADPRSVVVWDSAATEIVRRSMAAANQTLPEGQELVVHKNNSDGKGNSYGCHENYLMARAVPVRADHHPRHRPLHHAPDLHRGGQGRLRGPGTPRLEVPYQLTQRADFFEAEVGLETTLKRPIINTRDEPHADAQKYRRLHVIVGDANLAEVATFLKVGTTAFVLSLIEDDAASPHVRVRQPGGGHAPGLLRPEPAPAHRVDDGSTVTALEVQWELLDRSRRWADAHGSRRWAGRPGRSCSTSGRRC
jgi:Pup amidohydrolase